jgi:hypothetical protein
MASMTKSTSSGRWPCGCRGLLHQLGVDAQASGRVDDDDVVLLLSGVVDAVAGDLDGVADAVPGSGA